MPSMTGRQLADAVTGLILGLKIHYTTGHTRNGVVQNEMTYKEIPLLQKPLSPAQLDEKVRELLDL